MAITFSERLNELRSSKKITQENLAKELGIAVSTISMYERGERIPSLEVLEKIADFFNVDLDYLLGRRNTTTNLQENNGTYIMYKFDTSGLKDSDVASLKKELDYLTEFMLSKYKK